MTQQAFQRVTAGTLLSVTAAVGLAADRSFVSTTGKDAWACTAEKPCRTVGRAVSVTDPGGSVLILDSGRFSEATVTIRQAITIVAVPGALAELTAPTYAVIAINAGAADVVVLKNLVLSGQPAAPNNGVVYNSAAELQVLSCLIRDFPTYGIGTYGGNKRLVVADTTILGTQVGLSLYAGSAARTELTRVTLTDNAIGAGLFGGNVTVNDSLAFGNSDAGFLVDGCTGDAEATFERCTASGNGIGVNVRSNVCGTPAVATARLSGCTVTGNTTGVAVDAASTAASRGNNTITGNDTDVTGVLAALLPR